MKNRLCLQVTTYLPTPPKNLKYIILVLIAVLSIGGIIAYITSSTGSNSDTDTETEWLSATDTVTNSEPDNASSVTVHAGTSAENINPEFSCKRKCSDRECRTPCATKHRNSKPECHECQYASKRKERF